MPRSSRAPPYCSICSSSHRPVHHDHTSPREVRILQGVEYEVSNLIYMCPTCVNSHPARPDIGLNVVVSTGQLHNIHHPSSPVARSDPDPFHIDWLTVCGATIPELETAWLADYRKQVRPMRILISAGTDDFAMGRTRDEVVESLMHFKNAVDKQNEYHPEVKNEFVVATLLNPPKICWFPDNGPAPANHTNMLADLKEINSWIINFNKWNGKDITPRFHRFGVRDGWELDMAGNRVKVKRHIMSQWLQSEPRGERMHLSDRFRVRLGVGAVRHFRGEYERFGKLG